MTKYNIDENAILTEIKEYELDRGPDLGRLRISIHRVIEGGKSGYFLAVPNLLGYSSKEKYITEGESEEEVLANCLDKMKGLPGEEIFPKLKEAKEQLNKSIAK
jgi:hypothetical protein